MVPSLTNPGRPKQINDEPCPFPSNEVVKACLFIMRRDQGAQHILVLIRQHKIRERVCVPGHGGDLGDVELDYEFSGVSQSNATRETGYLRHSLSDSENLAIHDHWTEVNAED